MLAGTRQDTRDRAPQAAQEGPTGSRRARSPPAGTVGKGWVETALLESAVGNRTSRQDRGGH